MASKKTWSKAEARLKTLNTLRDILLEFAIEAEGEETLTREQMIEMRENLVEVADVIMEDLYVEVVSVSADGTVTITVKPDPDTF
jgi:hypothetical protein